MQIDLFIFDWSGTISDDRRPVYEAGRKILEDNGKSIMPFEEWCNSQSLFRSGRKFLRHYGIEGSDDELREMFRDAYLHVSRNGIRPRIYPSAQDAITHLFSENRKLAVVSSHPTDFVLAEAKDYGIYRCFRWFEGDAHDKEPAIRKACRIFCCNPGDVAYIGDTIDDVKDARKAGVVPVAVLGGYHKEEELRTAEPDSLIRDLPELTTLEILRT